MKKAIVNTPLIAGIFLILFSLHTPDSFAQTPPTLRPFMWVSKRECGKDRANFKKKKLVHMSRNAGTSEVYLNTSFSLVNFWKWITYFDNDSTLRGERLYVYLGINDDKKVVLIFTPLTAMPDENNDTSYVFEKKWDGADPAGLGITPDKKKRWRQNFVDAMYLTKKDSTYRDNQYPKPGTGQKPSDTRFISYCWADIFEMQVTKNYFAPKADLGDDVRAYLAAFPKTGARRGENPEGFKNRIILYFDLLDTGGADVNLSKLEGFPKRRRPLSNCGSIKPADNGQLCPTTCN